MRKRSLAIVAVLVFIVSALPASTVAADSLRSRNLIRENALRNLREGDCNKKLTNLRRLVHVEEDRLFLREQILKVLRQCEDPTVRSRAILLIPVDLKGSLPKDDLKELFKGLGSNSLDVRMSTTLYLARAGVDISDRITSNLTLIDNHTELVFSYAALRELGIEKQPNDSLVARLPQILRDLLYEPSDELLSTESEILGDLFPEATLQAIPDLVEESGRCGEECRDSFLVVRNKWRQSETIQELSDTLAENDRQQSGLIQQIGFLGHSNPSSLFLLKNALESQSSDRVTRAIEAISELGSERKTFLPLLEELATSSDELIRREAAYTFVEIVPEGSSRMLEALSQVDPDLGLELKVHILESTLD